MRGAIIALACLWGCFTATAAAQDVEPPEMSGLVSAGRADCSTPRRALSTWLANLQEEQEHPAQATRCFDWAGAAVTDHDQQATLARHLKRVIDARGLFVEMEDIPDEEEPEGVDEVAPFPNQLPLLTLVREGSQWVVSDATIARIPRWYRETFAFDLESYVDSAPPWMRARVLGIAVWQVIALALLLLVLFVLRRLITQVLARRAAKLLARLVTNLDAVLLERAAKPIGTLIAVLAAMWAIPILELGVGANRAIMFGLRVAIGVTSVVIVYRLVDVASDVFQKRAGATETKLDDQLVPLVRKSVKVVTVVLGAIFVLQNMDVDVASLIAGASLGGLAFSLAARDTVANLFGSLSIFADQPFQVGDWVVMQGIEGVVEEVGMRSTRVRTFYSSLVSIPNSKVADGVIDNYGLRKARRCYLKLGLQYDTSVEQMEAFCDGVRGILQNNPAVKKDVYHVYFSGFGDSSLEVMLYFFFDVKTWADELKNRHLVFLEIMRLAEALGCQFAFPTRTLHIASQAAPAELEAPEVPSIDEMGAAVIGFGPGGALAHPEGPRISHGFYAGGAPAPPKDQGEDPDADLADSRE
ncbi:MAG: mechanosensitive ion channel family protein [Sandaracinaceae bacterium]